jgi:hypothetical protein
MVQWYECLVKIGDQVEDQYFSDNIESTKAMQEVHSDPYFIGGPLPFLDKYR